MSDSAIVGHIGRKGLRFALTDAEGRLDPQSIRFHPAESSTSIAGAISGFQREMGLGVVSRRSAFAVAGLVRGDTISVTRTRWFLSRSGLTAMLGHAPLVLNDFEAEGWAFAGADDGWSVEPTALPTPCPRKPGTYCVAGVTSGLGVSVLRRGEDGRATVLSTEAGHAPFTPSSCDHARLVGAILPGRHDLTVEEVMSASGLQAIYRYVAAEAGTSARFHTPEAITANCLNDPSAGRASELLGEMFHAYLGNLVLTYGAWDGVVVTGGLARALRQIWARPAMQAAFQGTGRYARILAEVPRAIGSIPYAELVGAAEALNDQSQRVARDEPARVAVESVAMPWR
jgi:glucokinase